MIEKCQYSYRKSNTVSQFQNRKSAVRLASDQFINL